MSRKNFNYKNKIIILALLLVTVMCFAGCGDFLSQFEETEEISSGLATVSDVMTGFVSDASSYLESEFGVGIEIEGFNDADSEAKKKIKKGVEKAKEVDADLIMMSTLMTTTMPGMKEVIQKLKDQGIRDSVKVMVGGSPISMKYAEDIGADGYSRNAVEAVEVAKKLCGITD